MSPRPQYAVDAPREEFRVPQDWVLRHDKLLEVAAGRAFVSVCLLSVMAVFRIAAKACSF